jgi:hypothetical protein
MHPSQREAVKSPASSLVELAGEPRAGRELYLRIPRALSRDDEENERRFYDRLLSRSLSRVLGDKTRGMKGIEQDPLRGRAIWK